MVTGLGGQSALVDLIIYDPAEVKVPVARGENRGRNLRHANVARQSLRLGHANETLDLPDPGHHLEMAILVSAYEGGPILGAARVA